MKKLIYIFIAVLMSSSIAHAQEFSFQKSSDYSKLDLRARNAWLDAMRSGDEDRNLKCMLKVTERMSQDQKNKLASAGFEPTTIIQTIVTGQARANKIPKIAALDFVQIIELAMPLDLKKDPGYKKYGVPRSVRRVSVSTEKKEETRKADVKKEEESTTKAEDVSTVPVEPDEATPEVPIYQSPDKPIYPNRPPTSNDFPGAGGGGAIAPPDRSDPIIPEKTKPPTEVVIEPAAKVPFDAEEKAPMPEQKPAEQGVYAP